MTGWRIGAKEYEQCDRGTQKAAIYGVITATCFFGNICCTWKIYRAYFHR